MNSKKLWHSLLLLFGYLLFSAAVSTVFGYLCHSWTKNWWCLLIIGAVFWIASAIFSAKRMDCAWLGIPALIINAIGLGFFIAAYTVGMNIDLPPLSLFALACITALCFLFLMLLLSIPVLAEHLWYTVVAYLVWLAGVICLGIFLFPHIFTWLRIPVPEQFGMYVFFYLLMLGFMVAGILLCANDFLDSVANLLTPALAASFLVLIIVLFCLSEGDACEACDCGGCDSCECGSHSGGNIATHYQKKSSISQTMSNLSNP